MEMEQYKIHNNVYRITIKYLCRKMCLERCKLDQRGGRLEKIDRFKKPISALIVLQPTNAIYYLLFLALLLDDGVSALRFRLGCK